MKRTLAIHLFTASILFCLTVLPFISLAGHGAEHSDPGSSVGSGSGVGITNPLKSKINNIPAFLNELLDIAIMLAVPVAVMAIIYAGFLYVTARGNVTKISDAHRTLLYTVIGVAVLFGAKIIAAVVSNTVNSLKG
ncbi:MAG: hypothetical protein Q7S15_02335 [bacterium]|nr:hypothetical protein [bacterium]